MRSVQLVYRAEVRRTWRSWLAVVVLVALAGGSVLAAVIAGQRTRSAFSSFVDGYGYDAVVVSLRPEPRLASLPEVASLDEVPAYINSTVAIGDKVLPSSYTSFFGLPASSSPPVDKLLAGHLPAASRPSDVLVSFALAQQFGVHVGTILTVPFYAPSQAQEVFTSNGTPPTHGPTLKMTVVGIEATIADFPSGSTTFSMFVGPGFGRAVGSRVLTAPTAFIRLRHGPDELARFHLDVNRLFGSTLFFAQSYAPVDAAVQHSIQPQAVGWDLLALLVGLAALAVVGQAFARQSLEQAQSYPTLRALGLRPRELLWLSVFMAASVGLLGALGAAGLAWALSPLTPVGLARVAAPSTGFVLDPVVLLLGAGGILLLCVALGAIAAWRSTRTLGPWAARNSPTVERSSGLAMWRTGAGALPSALVGTRRALQRGSGRSSVPVATALLGSGLAVTALVATVVFGASLSNLTRTPSLYGQAWQLQLGNGPTASGLTGNQVHAIVAAVRADPAIDHISYFLTTPNNLTIGGVSVPTLLVETAKGSLTLPVISGHLPDGDGQMALGESTLRQVGGHIGSIVPLTTITKFAGPHTVPFEVVGTTSFAPTFQSGGLGTGAVLTPNAAIEAICGSGPAHSACQKNVEKKIQTTPGWAILISVIPGPAGHATLVSLSHRYAAWVQLPVTPNYLVDFGEAVNFPLLLGIPLALFGAATFTHLLVASVTRRRRDVALLKALGFVCRQIAAAVGWQATTVALLAIAFGVPVGIAVGRLL